MNLVYLVLCVLSLVCLSLHTRVTRLESKGYYRNNNARGGQNDKK